MYVKLLYCYFHIIISLDVPSLHRFDFFRRQPPGSLLRLVLNTFMIIDPAFISSMWIPARDHPHPHHQYDSLYNAIAYSAIYSIDTRHLWVLCDFLPTWFFSLEISSLFFLALRNGVDWLVYSLRDSFGGRFVRIERERRFQSLFLRCAVVKASMALCVHTDSSSPAFFIINRPESVWGLDFAKIDRDVIISAVLTMTGKLLSIDPWCGTLREPHVYVRRSATPSFDSSKSNFRVYQYCFYMRDERWRWEVICPMPMPPVGS